MRKLLLIATLSLGTFAFAQTMNSKTGDAQPAGNDSYNQKIAAQTKLQVAGQAANSASATFSAKSEGSKDAQPGSMASNAGSQNAGDEFYSRHIVAQANANKLALDANRE